MITLQEICRYLDELLASSSFSDHAPNGLQVEGKREIHSIATAVTASLQTLQEAVTKGVDLLLVHHGLFWNKDSPIVTGVKRQKLMMLLQHEISLLAYHLPLDAHQRFGNNWCAAIEMGWTELQPFLFINGVPIGVRARLPKMSVDAFAHSLEAYYGHPVHAALGGPKMIETVALVSGGAHRSLPDALQAHVDCFVTGSFDEPVWHQAHEEKIHFFALGHAATERIGPRAIGQHLSEQFKLPWYFIADDNPF